MGYDQNSVLIKNPTEKTKKVLLPRNIFQLLPLIGVFKFHLLESDLLKASASLSYTDDSNAVIKLFLFFFQIFV